MATLTADKTLKAIFPTNGSTVERALCWYDHDLRKVLESREHLGKHVIIHPDTGDWEMGSDPEGEDDLDVSHRAIERFGTARLFGLRIGYPVSEAIGTMLEPFPHLLGDEPDGERR